MLDALKDRYALKAYTDNITIGWPILRDAESECGEAFQKLCEFQFRMTVAGFFIRGALSVGDAYVDEIAVFGKALDEAYHGETTLARDPRIIITASTKTAMKRHINYYASPEGSPQVFYVLRDSDGQWFINYLAYVLWLEEEVGPLYEEMMQHKRAVELKLDEHKKQPAIWSKYAWVARYHNFFCDRYSHHFDDTFKIDLNLFTSQPARIIDER